MTLNARLQSLRRQGLRRSAQTGLSLIEDALFSARYGVETAERVSAAELGGLSDRGRDYHPTRARHFRTLMRSLSLPPGLGFADIGSGKGLVLLLATEQPFARIVGVEHSAALCDVARANLARYQARTGRGARVSVHHADATVFPITPDLNVFYLFNPFEDVILDKVVANITASLRAAPRPGWIITNKARLEGLDGYAPHLEMAYGNAEFQVVHWRG